MHPILDSIKPVIKYSEFVRTNKDNILKSAPDLAKNDFPKQDLSDEIFVSGLAEKEIIDFILILNSINFKFWFSDNPNQKFEILHNGKKYLGYYALCTALKNANNNDIPIFDAGFLANLSLEKSKEIFTGLNTIPMLEERTNILNEVGNVLLEKHDGHFYNLIKSSNKAFDNGKGLIDILVKDFPSYNDFSIYVKTGTELKFYKRAQLAMAMLHSNPKINFELQDHNALTVPTDYRLPQALRFLGLIEYEPSLAHKVDSQILIPANSQEEQEIRAHTIHASDLLYKEINKHREDKINAAIIDNFLWFKGRACKTFYHLTETIAY